MSLASLVILGLFVHRLLAIWSAWAASKRLPKLLHEPMHLSLGAAAIGLLLWTYGRHLGMGIVMVFAVSDLAVLVDWSIQACAGRKR